MKGRHLDLSSEPDLSAPVGKRPPGDKLSVDDTHASEACPGARPGARPFIGVHFTCCDIYLRVYINHDETAYDGRCPRCGRAVHFRVGSGGTNARFFTAS